MDKCFFGGYLVFKICDYDHEIETCSSKVKRQPARKGRPNRSPLRDDIINGDASTKLQNAPDDRVSSSQLGTSLSSIVASSASINVNAEGVDNSSSLGGRDILVIFSVKYVYVAFYLLS